jgi:hypothetical protein
MFPLGSKIEDARKTLTIYQARNYRREDFDLDKVKPNDGMTLAKWADCYLNLEEVKTKRSLSRERELIATIKRLLGSVLLTELKRRLQEHIIRGGKEAAKTVSLGTVANELSCLRHMLNKARESEIEVATPSFAGLIQRSQRERILDAKEEKALLEAYPAWLKRVAIVAQETCLSQGDIIRLTKSMIDR